LTLYKLNEVISGDLNEIVQPLINEDQADKLAALGGQ
jgi:peptide chain release factor 1